MVGLSCIVKSMTVDACTECSLTCHSDKKAHTVSTFEVIYICVMYPVYEECLQISYICFFIGLILFQSSTQSEAEGHKTLVELNNRPYSIGVVDSISGVKHVSQPCSLTAVINPAGVCMYNSAQCVDYTCAQLYVALCLLCAHMKPM